MSELNFSLHVYSQEFTIEGLLGITLDNDNVFLVNINETVRYEEEDEEEDMLRQPQIKVTILLPVNMDITWADTG